MITLEQAKSLTHGQVLHDDYAVNADGTCQRWRVNGKVKTWKRQPWRIRIPVKCGLYNYGYVTEATLKLMHLLESCPRNTK